MTHNWGIWYFLPEKFDISTKATCFIREKNFHLLSIDRKQHTKMFYRAYTKSSNVKCVYEPKAIFVFLACRKFSSEKALYQFIKRKENFVKSVEIVLGVDTENTEQDTIQMHPLNVPIWGCLHLFQNPDQENLKSGYLHTFCDGKTFKNNDLFRTSQNCLKIILYHNDFGSVNPLGNKVSKYTISAFT